MTLGTEKMMGIIMEIKKCRGYCLWLLLALCLAACGDNKSASQEEVGRFIKSAQTYTGQGQYRAAMLEAKNAIQKSPESAAGYVMLAEIYNTLGAFVATQTLLEPRVKTMPEAALALSEAYVETRKYRSALNLLTESKPANETAAQAYERALLMARCHIYLGDTEALATALSALEKFTEHQVGVKILSAESLLAQGKHEQALGLLEGLSSTEKTEQVRLLLFKGNIALQQNALARAEDSYTQALALLPNTDLMTAEKLIVLGQLTDALIKQGKSGEAYSYQKIIAEANPEGNAAKEKFNDAMELFRQGKFPEAEATLKELREQFPQDKNTAILLGLVEYQKGQDKQAIDLFDQYIDPETTASSVIQAAALAKFRANKMDDAIALLKNSVAGQPDNAELLATYGLALLEQDKTSAEGQKALEKSLALNPKQQRLRLALAKRDFEMKNPALGLGQLQKAYHEQPLDLVIQQSYFKALFADGKLDIIKAEIADFQKANPTNARGSFLEGWFNLVQKKYPDAEQAFKKAVAVKDNAEKMLSYAGLAEVYKSQGQLTKAASVFEDMLTLDASQAALYGEWLGVMQKSDRIKDALVFLNALEEKPENWMPSIVLAQVLVTQGQTAGAIKHIETALARNGKSEQVKKIAANIYWQHGVSLGREQKLAEAKTHILKALTLDASNMNILASLIELEIVAGNASEAQKLLDQYAAANSESAERDYLQGVIKAAQQQPEEALNAYQQSWAKKPLEVTALAIVSHYKKVNKNAELFNFVAEWSTKLPNSAQAMLGMAINAQQKNESETAVKWYEKFIAVDVTNAAAFNNLAWLYYEQKNPKAAEMAEKAYKLDAKNPAIVDTYGWVLVETGKVNEGYALLQEAVKLAPNNKELQDHLAEAKKRLKK